MKLENIKFRGVPLKAQKHGFIKGDLIRTSEGRYFIFPEGEELNLTNLIKGKAVYSGFGLLVEIKPETIGQFTGILDKNKKEIYEGDIVKAKYTYIEEKPFYDAKTGEFAGIRDKEEEIERIFAVEWHLDGFNLIPDKAVYWEFEVIGNIYENPELLNSKEV